MKNGIIPGRICGDDVLKVKEAVCINVEKIYDSCKEKDCLENAPVLFRHERCINHLINKAINVKIRRAEILDVYADVEEVPFKRGFYTVDVKFFIRVTLDFFIPTRRNGTRIVTVNGLVTFDKKVILFGSEGSVKIFKAHYNEKAVDSPMGSHLEQDNLPISKVEVAEPIALNARIIDVCECRCDECCCCEGVLDDLLGDLRSVEQDVGDLEFDEGHNESNKRVVVSLGLFTIIKLLRNVQLMIPAFGFCVPNKECVAATDENPCDLFDTIDFPKDEFFPPQKFEFPGLAEEDEDCCLQK